jgi:hypothetical protein
MTLEGSAEMLEVIPSGINFDKPARHKKSRTVVNGEK